MIDDKQEDSMPLSSSQEIEQEQSDVIRERTVVGLLARLKSYASLPWSNKPIEVSPLVCSRHGWLSREPDTLGCVACGASLCVRLPPPAADNFGQQLMDTVTNLARAHSDDCPWQNDPMPDDTPLLPFTDPEADLRAFLKISGSLAPICSAVNSNVRFALQCTVARDLIEFVRSRSDCLLSLPEDVRHRCCLLAIAGWCPDQPDQGALARSRLICCCFCQRRVGLWSLNRGMEHQQQQQQLSAQGQQQQQQASATAVVIDDASLSDGVEAGMSLGAAAGVGSSGSGGMPAPSYALTEMIINRQLLFAKKQHSVSDWSLISNAGSEAASIRDLDEVQSVAGSTVSNLSAGDIANQLQDIDQQQQQQQQPTPPSNFALSLLNLPPSSTASGGGGSQCGDPDNWSTMTNADSDRRSIAQSDVAASFILGSGDESGSGGKRPRLEALDDASVGSTSAAPGLATVDLLALHWAWCPWRPGDPSEDWCRSVLSLPVLDRPDNDGDNADSNVEDAEDGDGCYSGSGGRQLSVTPPTPTPAPM